MTAQDDANQIRDTLAGILPQLPAGPARDLVQLQLHSVNDDSGTSQVPLDVLIAHITAAIAIFDVRLTALENGR